MAIAASLAPSCAHKETHGSSSSTLKLEQAPVGPDLCGQASVEQKAVHWWWLRKQVSQGTSVDYQLVHLFCTGSQCKRCCSMQPHAAAGHALPAVTLRSLSIA